MSALAAAGLPHVSLPVWEEWIEMSALAAAGLPHVTVSSRMGRVD